MLEIELNIEDIYSIGTEKILSILTSSSSITLIMKHEYIGFAREHTSIGLGFLDILFVGETLNLLCENIDFIEKRESYYLYIHFSLIPKFGNEEKLAEKLVWLSEGLYNSGNIEEIDNDIRLEISDFQEEIDEYKRAVKFDKLADAYLMNHVEGIIENWDFESAKSLYIDHPEWQYRFIRPYRSFFDGNEFYSSSWVWIVPHDVNIEKILSLYAGFDETPVILSAKCLTITGLPKIIFNEKSFVYYPSHTYLNDSIKCAKRVFLKSSHDRASHREWMSLYNEKILGFELSENNDVLILSDKLAKYVFFNPEIPPFERAKNYLDIISSETDRLKRLIIGNIDVDINWELVDDEQFEQLCYDVIYCSKKFDVTTIKKMGKSRSRDGGRDIEVQTIERLGTKTEKWIVQCKFMKNNQTLSGSKLTGISDLIEQYSVDGLCIMTSGLIDSTLYDKLAIITKNRKVKLETWSRLELERFIARYPVIYNKYFVHKV